MSDLDIRFGGISRLFSNDGLQKLRRSHVCVIGVGGVGSWSVEAIARSGVGKITLVDLDEVCVSNVNRQLHAKDDEIGKTKVEVMAKRCREINPECSTYCVQEFFTSSNAASLLASGFDVVLDAIDNLANKALLISSCVLSGIPIVTTGGAGGRRDGTRIKVADLSVASHDPLLAQLRRKLRADYGFPKDISKSFGVPTVFSPERILYPQQDGTVCASYDGKTNLRLGCEGGYGTASFVTGAFGLAAAGVIINFLAEDRKAG